VFKFCYDPTSLRSLQREITLFRLLKEELGERDDISRILDWSFDQAPYFIESEYTEAGNLVDWAAEQGGLDEVPLAVRLEIVAQVATALAAAHSVGVLHKDVKPANILISTGQQGEVKARLCDFGVGMVTDSQRLADAGITVLGMSGKTESSDSGTRLYQAPEVLEGKPATLQSDIYALGLVLYQLVVGDLTRAMAPGWRRDITDEVLCEEIAAAVDGSPERRLGNALRLAEQLRTLEARREQREAERRELQEAAQLRATLMQTRRRRRMLAVAVVVLALFAGTMATMLVRVRREAERANLEARSAQAVLDFLVEMFEISDPYSHSDPDLARGTSMTVRELLDRSLVTLDTSYEDDPLIRQRLLENLAVVYQNLPRDFESELKAQVLDRFLQFVSAKPSAGEVWRSDVMEIGIVGRGSTTLELAALDGRAKTNGRLEIRRFGLYREGLDMSGCRILFITTSEHRRYSLILNDPSLRNEPVLTVAGGADFLDSCGMIQLTVGDTIGFRINMTPVEQAGLILDRSLIDLADQVTWGPGCGEYDPGAIEQEPKPPMVEIKKPPTPLPPLPAPSDVAAPPEDAIRTESGIAYKVLEPGAGKEHPKATSSVTIHYTGWTTDGKMFDSSVQRGKLETFPLENLPAGWSEGLQMMVTGEKRRLWIPEKLGDRDADGLPKGMLVFDVELHQIKEPVKTIPAPGDVAEPPENAERARSGTKIPQVIPTLAAKQTATPTPAMVEPAKTPQYQLTETPVISEVISESAREALQRENEAGKVAKASILYEFTLTDEFAQYDFNKSELSQMAKTVLIWFAEEGKSENKDVYIEVQGHTCSIGAEKVNLELGSQRAEQVMRYLNETHGFARHRMSTISYGESMPIGDNRTKEGRESNRRVVLVVME
jgi:outer membrane protein OmpA-like peptidoglycan-associated protein/serine/threonine protein kinase